MGMRLHRFVASLVTGAALAVVLAGCSTAGDDQDAAGDEAAGEDEASATESQPTSLGEGAVDGAGAALDAGTGPVAAGDPVDLDAVPVAAVDRKIVYTGTTSADVEDIAGAARAARDAATAEGGYVFAQELGRGDGRVVLKVPVDRFDAVFDAVVGIGDITDQQIEAEDVTERFVDLESRQAALATSIDRIRGFLAEATNVDEVSRLETELTRREAEHDVIAGQLRVLRERTTYGTITAHFHLADDAAPRPGDDDEGGAPGFGEGLSTGWDAVTGLAGALATALGFALPFAPAVVAFGSAAWWVRRRRLHPDPEGT